MKITKEVIEIFFDDLGYHAQIDLLRYLKIENLSETNWETVPIAVIPFPETEEMEVPQFGGEIKEEIPTSPLRKSDLKPGTQILYIPSHADGDPNHKDCEAGFVTSVMETKDFAFCRYWRTRDSNELRTRANSEATPIINLVVEKARPQFLVEEIMKWIEEKNEEWPGFPGGVPVKKKETA